jgi:hypothetical protein
VNNRGQKARGVAKKKLKKLDVLRIRVTVWELEKLRSYAEFHNLSMSDVVRRYIHRLPVQGELKDVTIAYLEEQR